MFSTLGLCLVVLCPGALPEPAPPGGQPPSEPERVLIRGRVVDDETGDPIESFSLETGRGKGQDPSGFSWGGSSRSVPNAYMLVDGKSVPIGRNPQGEFGDSLELGEDRQGRRSWLRILVDGYEPRTVTDRPPDPADAGNTLEVTVRLRRGRPLIGRVLDHDGRPAAGAKLFLIRPSGMPIRVVDGVTGEGADTGLLDPGVTRAVADTEGRFRLTGVGDATAIGVSAPSVHFWKVPIVSRDEEMTIRLPEPATIRIPYAIPGDEAETELQFYLSEPGGPERRYWVRRNFRVANGGEVIVRDATPGRFTLWRMKMITHGDYHRRSGVERRDVDVGSGGVAILDFVRRRGRPITGKVAGPADGNARMIFVGIEPAGEAGKLAVIRQQLLDIVPCGADGRFETALIPPGEYNVRAVGYRDRPRYGPFAGMMEASDFVGSAPAVVPADGNPPEVEVRLDDPRR